MNSKDFDAFMRKCMNEAPTPDNGQYVSPKNKMEHLKYSIKVTMKPKDIMSFVSGLHDVQLDMIETVVIAKEKQGFPEASVVIDHIRNLK
jgi:hypothetical protein